MESCSSETLSVGERVKGHSDIIKLVLFLSKFHVYKYVSRLSEMKGSFFLKSSSLEFVCEERG